MNTTLGAPSRCSLHSAQTSPQRTGTLLPTALTLFAVVGIMACGRANAPHSTIPDEAVRKESLKREAACAAPTRASSFPLVKMNLQPSASPTRTMPTGASSYREPPPGLLAQRKKLAECLQPGERIAVRFEPTAGLPKVESICQAARSEALECVRRRIEPFEMNGPLAVTLSANEVQETALNLPEPHDCYRGLLSIYPGAQGEITFGFMVGPNGKVAASDILVNATGVPELACCVENVVAKHTFAPDDCSPHIVRIPFVLR